MVHVSMGQKVDLHKPLHSITAHTSCKSKLAWNTAGPPLAFSSCL